MQTFMRLSIVFSIILSSVFLSGFQNLSSADTVDIGFLIDGDSEFNSEILFLFKREINDLLADEFQVNFPDESSIVCDYSMESIGVGFETLMNDREVDLVITMGVLSSYHASKFEKLRKPVIAPFAYDAELLKLPTLNGTSGRINLNYINIPSSTRRNLEAFREVVQVSNMTFFMQKEIYETIPQLDDEVMEIGDSMGITIIIIPVGDSLLEALLEMPDDTEAVYVGPLIQIERAEMGDFSEELIKLKLPSFAALGRMDVEQGLLMGLIRSDFMIRRARRTALNIQRILLGSDAGSLPVAYSANQLMCLNMATARAIDVSPTWAVLSEAELISEKRKDIRRLLTLSTAMEEAVKVNLELAAEELKVAAGRQNIKRARANLLPQITLSGTGLMIDDDRAEASFGQQAEQSFTGHATLTQMLYSEPAFANLSIQKHLQNSLEYELKSFKLDIIHQSSTSYLQLLKAKTNEEIQKNNLKLVRSFYELAKVREVIGFAGPAEVYRWEAEIAAARNAAIQANSFRNLAEMELNRILHRPAEEPFATAEANLSDPGLLISDARMFEYINNKRLFSLLRSFYVTEGLRNSPELAQLDAAIAASERLMKSRKSAHYSPTLALQGEVSELMWEDGAGADGGLDLGVPMDMPEADDTNWSVGLNLSFPLFTGGSRSADYAQAREDLKALHKTRQAMLDRIEQQIRSTLHIAQASFASISLANAQAAAARKSLELISDSYARGAVSIIELLDSQNAAIIADIASANAVYTFLIDYMNAQRAIGSFDLFQSEVEREAHFKRLEDFLLEYGAKTD